MPKNEVDPSELRPSLWEAVMLFLSVMVLGMLAVEALAPPDPEVAAILQAADTMICVVFIGDFFARLARARDKRHFLKWNWVDLAASVPNVDWLRAGRLVRMVRAVRAFRSARVLLGFLFRRRASGTLTSAAAVAFVVWFFSAIAILGVETDKEANIRNASDALWWAFTTISTVGYGEFYPVSPEGRVIAAGLMLAGVGLFGTFTAAIASAFVTSGDDADELRKLRAEIGDIREKLEQALASRGDTGGGKRKGTDADAGPGDRS